MCHSQVEKQTEYEFSLWMVNGWNNDCKWWVAVGLLSPPSCPILYLFLPAAGVSNPVWKKKMQLWMIRNSGQKSSLDSSKKDALGKNRWIFCYQTSTDDSPAGFFFNQPLESSKNSVWRRIFVPCNFTASFFPAKDIEKRIPRRKRVRSSKHFCFGVLLSMAGLGRYGWPQLKRLVREFPLILSFNYCENSPG